MRSDELLQWLRLDAYIGDATQYPDQTDLVLLGEMTHKLHSVFEDIVVKARAGYWLQEFTFNTVVGVSKYRIPTRSIVGGLEKIDLSPSSTAAYCPLDEVRPADSADWEGPISGNPGQPQVYVFEGDTVQLFPTPSAVFPMRMTYYIRPSRLAKSQSSTLGGDAVVRGLITSRDPVLRTITVNVVPFDQELAVPAAITTAVQRIDVVKNGGWYELALVGETQTLAGAVFTVGGSQDMSQVAVGDWVRAAEQSEWPCLPDDYHRSLADVAAIKVSVELGLRQKNDTLAQNVENDLIRFRSALGPRNKSQPKETPVFLGSRGGGGGRYWLNYP